MVERTRNNALILDTEQIKMFMEKQVELSEKSSKQTDVLISLTKEITTLTRLLMIMAFAQILILFYQLTIQGKPTIGLTEFSVVIIGFFGLVAVCGFYVGEGIRELLRNRKHGGNK